MMSKAAHARNAFSYNCFGATPVVADASEKIVDKWGFSIVGNDGADKPTAYYASTVTIPDVIPDGKYVMGWIWYGGTGGPVSNDPYTEEPYWKGFFGDYWSCAFVEISGGAPLASSYTPVFVNDMSKFSEEGCMSANDSPGVCIREPCVVEGTYMKPKPFKNDNVPDDLTPANFGGSDIVSEPREEVEESVTPETSPTSPGVVVTPVPFVDGGAAASSSVDLRAQEVEVPVSDPEFIMRKQACDCLISGGSCDGKRAWKTGGSCLSRTKAEDQPSACKNACCEYCRFETLSGQGEKQRRRLCNKAILRPICNL